MAFTHVQGAQFAVASATPYVDINTTQGNLVVVNIRILDTSKTVNSVTDNAGNTYYKAYGPRDYNTVRQWQYWGIQNNPATRITANLGSSATARIQVSEFSMGAGMTAEIDTPSVATSGGNGTDANVAMTPAQSGELVVACIGRNVGGSSITPQNSYVSSVTVSTMDTIYKLNASTSETPRLTWVTSSDWVIIASAFKEVSASASSQIKKLAGVVQASLKKISGVTIANVKKVAGVNNT